MLNFKLVSTIQPILLLVGSCLFGQNSCPNPQTFNDPLGNQNLLELMNIPCAWDITEGGGVVCVFDQYLDDTHPDLEGKVLVVHDSPECNSGNADWHHGIQSFGAIAAIRNNGICVAGSGGTETLVAGYCGYASSDGLIEAMNAGYKTISISAWSGISRSAMEELHKNDVTVLVAGFEQFHQTYQDIPGVIHVGRAWINGHYREYGGINSNLDVLAHTWKINRIFEGDNCGISDAQGTSIGTPIVAGVVALMKSVNPCLFPEDIEGILVETAAPIPPNADESITRAGVINAEAAVLMAQNFQGFDEVIDVNTTIEFENVSGDLDIMNNAQVLVTGSLNTSSESSIIIHGGSSLRIDGGEIKMGELARIIVKRGAQLFVDNGTITNRCGGLWKGIIVEGNASGKQKTSFSPGGGSIAFANPNGVVKIKNNSTIKNARTAISMNPSHIPWPQTQNYYGGYVEVTDSDFINNTRCIAFMKYRNTDNSFFKRVNFIGGGSQCTHWANHGVLYEDCYFGSFSQNGILSIDAAGEVYKCDFDGSSMESTQGASIEISYPGGREQVWKIGETSNGNNFYGGERGVNIIGADNPKTLEVLSNIFQCVRTPIRVDGLSRFKIESNKFYNSSQWANQLISTGSGKDNQSISNYYLNSGAGIMAHFDNIGYTFAQNTFVGTDSYRTTIWVNGQPRSRTFIGDFQINGQNNLIGRIAMDQGEEGGASASNVFSAPDRYTVRVAGNAFDFDYHITDQEDRSKRSTLYDGQKLDASFSRDEASGPRNWTCSSPRPIQRGYTPPDDDRGNDGSYSDGSSSYDRNSYRQQAIFLKNQLQNIPQDEPGDGNESYLYDMRYSEYLNHVYEIIYNEFKDGEHQYVMDLYHNDGFMVQRKILQHYIMKELYEDALGYLPTVNTENEIESDYLWVQELNLNNLLNNKGPSDSELYRLQSITLKRDPLCGLAHSMYHRFTGNFIPLEENDFEFLEGRSADKGISENIGLTINPNPSSDIIHIAANYLIKEIKVYDLTGRLQIVKEIGENTTELNLVNFQNGVYLVEILSVDNNKPEIRKVIKQ